MIRHVMYNRFQRETERAQQEREDHEHIQRLRACWRRFPLPVQEELALHLRRFGLDAAQHATAIAERLHAALMETLRTTDPP